MGLIVFFIFIFHCLFVATFKTLVFSIDAGLYSVCEAVAWVILRRCKIFWEKWSNFIFLFLRWGNFNRLIKICVCTLDYLLSKFELSQLFLILNSLLHQILLPPVPIDSLSCRRLSHFRLYALSLTLCLLLSTLVGLNRTPTLINAPCFFKLFQIFEPHFRLIDVLIVVNHFLRLFESTLQLNDLLLAETPDGQRQQIVILLLTAFIGIVVTELSRLNSSYFMILFVVFSCQLPHPRLLLLHHLKLSDHHCINEANLRLQDFTFSDVLG